MHNVLRVIPQSMKPHTCRAVFVVAAMAVSAVAQSFAQPAQPAGQAAAPAPVEVSTVKFRPVNGGWYEAEVEVQGKPSPAATANRGFINRVKVTLNLGISSVKAASDAKIPDTYYKASAEAVAIEVSGKTSFRFYLPPEIVKRDQITGQQRFYLVELSVGGNAVPPSKNDVGGALINAQYVEGFRSKAASESSANDGVMLPQHLSPFAYASGQPSVIRNEGGR